MNKNEPALTSEPRNARENSIVVTGLGAEVLERAEQKIDVLPWLLTKKMRKFMGKQDMLAVVAAGRCLANAGLPAPAQEEADPARGERSRQTEREALEAFRRDRMGVYLSVGYIPFERGDIDGLAISSVDQNGEFSMERFGKDALLEVNPLLAFRCLPNMPIFHISLNFKIQGPYFIAYPGVGQFYLALEEALFALEDDRIDLALLGGVADQDNFLVAHHFKKSRNDNENFQPLDAGGFLCLERREAAKKRGAQALAILKDYRVSYQAPDFEGNPPIFRETLKLRGQENVPSLAGARETGDYRGPGSLPVLLQDLVAKGERGEFFHGARAMDGIEAESVWELL